MKEVETKREADKVLVRDAWALLWRRKAPLWAALGIVVVFTVRVVVCSYEDPIAEGLDFEWYGNHCGPGHGTGDTVIDELDEACRRHDEAYKAGSGETKS
jgi:hypothetical protein